MKTMIYFLTTISIFTVIYACEREKDAKQPVILYFK
jgi:hypothetical protein